MKLASDAFELYTAAHSMEMYAQKLGAFLDSYTGMQPPTVMPEMTAAHSRLAAAIQCRDEILWETNCSLMESCAAMQLAWRLLCRLRWRPSTRTWR